MSKFLLGAMLATAACSHTQALAISGSSIGAMGDQFIQTADAFYKAYDGGTITKDQYATWKQFGLKFQIAFPAAVELWHVAVITDDDVMNAKAVSLLADLQAPLIQFAADIAAALPKDK